MSKVEIKGVLDLLHEVNTIDALVFPQGLGVKQTYDHSQTRLGLRSTCQLASVLSAAELVSGEKVKDVQDDVITDARFPWDSENGGLPTVYEVLEGLAPIYNEYLPNFSVDTTFLPPLKDLFEGLLAGYGYTISTGRNHSVAVARLVKKPSISNNLDRFFSLFVNPISGKVEEKSWDELLPLLQTSFTDSTRVHANFKIGVKPQART